MAKNKGKSKSSKKTKKVQNKNKNNKELEVNKDTKNDVITKQSNKSNSEITSKQDNISKQNKTQDTNKSTSENISLKQKETKNNKESNKKTTQKQSGTKKSVKKTNENTKVKEDVKDKKVKEKEVLENKQKEEKKEELKKESKEVVKTNEKPEYIQKLIEKTKRVKLVFFVTTIIILFLGVFSTIFSILNSKNSKIINGVSIKNIDVSNLSKEEAIDKVTEALKKELIAEIELSYGKDYKVSLKPEQIEFIYDVESSVENAHKRGREGNIVIDNYKIIFTAIFGKKVNVDYGYNDELLNQFVEDVRAKLPGIVIEPTYYIEEDKLFVNKGIDGIDVIKEELKNQILSSIVEREVGKIVDGFKQQVEIPTESVKASKIDMKKIQKEIQREPKNAYFETDPYKIYPDIVGVDLILSVEDAQKIVEQENKDEYSFDLKITEAEITVDDLGKEAFPHLISTYSTRYDASNRNRSTNLEIAAEKINGKVLMPGEEFSFNKVVGKRTVEAGYKDAAIYADGGVVDGLAGGICQISTTLYNSVLLANLQITERRNHSFTTSYAPAGRDATVVWGTTDFRFINTRSYPVKIEATVKNGIAEFRLHGMQEEVEYEVKILPVRTQSIPYNTTYEEDLTVIPGQQIVKQAGHSGCKVTTYKELRLNGEVVLKEPISNDTYQPMRAIIKVAPGQKPV